MKEKEKIHKELEQLAPLLAKHKDKSSPFKVPEGYFDTLEAKVLEQVSSEEPKRSATIIRPLYFWLTSAAAIILLVVGMSVLFQSENHSENLLADISVEEIDRYISDNLHEFDEDLLLESSSNLSDLKNNDFSEEEINLYLEDNLEELEDLDLDQLL